MKRLTPWLRHCVQALVIAAMFLVPACCWYAARLPDGNADRLLAESTPSARMTAVRWVDRLLRPAGDVSVVDREVMRRRVDRFRGNLWGAQIFGVCVLEPLAGLESMAAAGVSVTILAALMLPALLALVLGRVFCSWLCPAGALFELVDRLRTPLKRLGLRPKQVAVHRRQKYIILAVGLLVAAVVGTPVLGLIYPPAVLAGESHGWVCWWLGQTDGTAPAAYLVAPGLLLIVTIAALELLVSRRVWCRSLCPGGGLYALLGRLRAVRVRREASACTDCADCVTACGMGLSPMRDRTGAECDNCLACVATCEPGALSLAIATTAAAVAAPAQGDN
jgi:ferredoxin-type protein NapH